MMLNSQWNTEMKEIANERKCDMYYCSHESAKTDIECYENVNLLSTSSLQIKFTYQLLMMFKSVGVQW